MEVETAILFILIYYFSGIAYDVNENGVYYFNTKSFRWKTATLFSILLILAFFFS